MSLGKRADPFPCQEEQVQEAGRQAVSKSTSGNTSPLPKQAQQQAPLEKPGWPPYNGPVRKAEPEVWEGNALSAWDCPKRGRCKLSM